MTPFKIPFTNLSRQYVSLKQELDEAYFTVQGSGKLLDWHFTEELEDALRKMTGRKYCFLVNSCTTALEIAAGIANEPLVTYMNAFSYRATRNAFKSYAKELLYLDVDDYGQPNFDHVDYRKAQSVVFANLFGGMADYDRLIVTHKLHARERNLYVVEDAAQSLGCFYKDKPSGSLGTVSCFSFDPTKIVGASHGGAILTDIDDVGANIRRSTTSKYQSGPTGPFTMRGQLGRNVRMTELDAAQVLIKLKYLNQWILRRMLIAQYYDENLNDRYRRVKVPPHTQSNYSRYVTRVPENENRKQVLSLLHLNDIEAKIHYEYNLNDNDGVQDNLLPYTRHMTMKAISLPLYPELTDGEVERIVNVANYAIQDESVPSHKRIDSKSIRKSSSVP